MMLSMLFFLTKKNLIQLKGVAMKLRSKHFIILLVLLNLMWIFSCQKSEEGGPVEIADPAKQEVTQEELTAFVPELRDLHEVVYPLWHSAFPDKDYDLIKELLPQAVSLTEELDQAQLPGILRDKQEAWDQGKEKLKEALDELKNAVESDDQEGMLNQTEAFHAGFERLMRIVRPVIPELDDFHKEMYKLYHYSAPNFDLEAIRSNVMAMKEKLTPLKEALLPKRLADREDEFETAVIELEAAVNELAEIVKKDDKEMILQDVEKAHAAYQKTEHIFD